MRRWALVCVAVPLLAACSTAGHPTAAPTVSSVALPSSPVAASPSLTSSVVSSSVGTSSRPRSVSSAASSAASRPGANVTPTVSLPPVTYPAGTGPLVALNPGHNGGNASHPDEINRLVPADLYGGTKPCDTTGTETNAGYPEHAFTWDVTLRVRTILQQRGVRVLLTRSDDTSVGPCVDERARIGNSPGVAAVISIHADGAPTDDHGFHVCYDSRPPAGPAMDARSRALSHTVHDALLRGSGLVPAAYIGTGDGYFPRSDLAALNLATVPSTFLEIGNMRNSGDAEVLSSASGRARIATAVAAGILSYLGR